MPARDCSDLSSRENHFEEQRRLMIHKQEKQPNKRQKPKAPLRSEQTGISRLN
jgi:hypothetical protein